MVPRSSVLESSILELTAAMAVRRLVLQAPILELSSVLKVSIL